MKKIFLSASMAALLFTACKKDDNNSSSPDFNVTKENAITDFVNKVALPGYAELNSKGTDFNAAIVALNANATDENLATAKADWRNMRSTWEKCEGYLFGPVADAEYDPETDTWPVNFNDLDSLLASAQTLTLTDIEALPRALKGYHPLEYILWGEGGTRTAASLTGREKEYMVSLSAHLKNQAQLLYNSWAPETGNYADVFLKSGNGSSIFPKKQDAFIALAGGMIDICGEVGDGKMREPYDLAAINTAAGAQIVESPFSGNSVTDFKNNITGAFNVYRGRFNDDGAGLEDLVKTKNSSLDVELQQKFNAAIESFNAITLPYEQAIASQRTQCQNAMNAIDDLAQTLDEKLKPFILQYITD